MFVYLVLEPCLLMRMNPMNRDIRLLQLGIAPLGPKTVMPNVLLCGDILTNVIGKLHVMIQTASIANVIFAKHILRIMQHEAKHI